MARCIVDEIKARPWCGYFVVGMVGEGRIADALDIDCPFLGFLDDLAEIIRTYRPEEIVVALTERRNILPVDSLVEAGARHKIAVTMDSDILERLTGKLAIESLTPSNVVFSREFVPSSFMLFCARTLSFGIAFLALIFSIPVFLLLAAIIKWDSPGPALFVQERVGLHGRKFNLYKFRSMRVSEERISEWVCDNRDRITVTGAFLRKYRLDELPQLINVLRGDMNLVGPRPHPASNFELFVLVARNMPRYGVHIPYYALRSSIRPGITGWAQVRYKYANGLNEEIEKLRYDLYYIKHQSLLLDIKILIETIKVIIFKGREEMRTDNPMLSEEQ
jgi:exopolysaccharide biosynthesis polyprenyl glycosylphosphotransferase